MFSSTLRTSFLLQVAWTGLFYAAPCVAVADDYEERSGLSDAEGIFEPWSGLFVANADGSGMRRITPAGEHFGANAPAWSGDGKWIVFEGWRPKKKETPNNPKVFVVSAEGGNPRLVSDGTGPSFSPGGKRIVFCRNRTNPGVWVMSSEGPEQELVLLDDRGTFPKWSPDGRKIAYVQPRQQQVSANVVVLDLVEGERTLLFDPQTNLDNNINRGLAWSPDSQRIAFLGNRPNGLGELGIVDVRGAERGLEKRDANFNRGTQFMSWSSDGERLLISQHDQQRVRPQLYFLELNSKGPVQLLPAHLLPGQHPGRANRDAAFSPDGKRLVIASSTNSIVTSSSFSRKKQVEGF